MRSSEAAYLRTEAGRGPPRDQRTRGMNNAERSPLTRLSPYDHSEMGEAPQLVLITGPVASGKSTISGGLAALLRTRGLRAASVDMDDLVFMVAGPDWRSVTPDDWHMARQAAAGLIDTLFSCGSDVVTVAGPFFGQSERDDLMGRLRTHPNVRCLILRVDLAAAIARASADPTGTLSKDPALLAELEKTIDWTHLPTDAIHVRTDGLTTGEVLNRAAAAGVF